MEIRTDPDYPSSEIGNQGLGGEPDPIVRRGIGRGIKTRYSLATGGSVSFVYEYIFN